MNVTAPKGAESGQFTKKLEIATATSNLKTLANLTRGTFLYANLETGKLCEDRATWYNPVSWYCCSSDWQDVINLVDQTFTSTIKSPDKDVKKLVAEANKGLWTLLTTYKYYGKEAKQAIEVIDGKINPYTREEFNQELSKLVNGRRKATSLSEFHRSPSFCCPQKKRRSLTIKIDIQRFLIDFENRKLNPKEKQICDLLHDLLKDESKPKEKSDLELRIEEALKNLKSSETVEAKPSRKRGCDLVNGKQVVNVSSNELRSTKKSLKKVNPDRKDSFPEDLDSQELITMLEKIREHVKLIDSDSESDSYDSDWTYGDEMDFLNSD